MSQSTTATTGLTSQYAAQVTSDLEGNLKEQDRISADIAALQEQLTALQHDHSVLVKVQQALGVSSATVQPSVSLDSATVPAARTKNSEEPGATGKRTRTTKAADAPGTAPKKEAATKSAGTAAAMKTAQPTLVELVRSHLIGQNEPRSAADVATALGTAHPKRGIKTTVVRTTLENLVAKNQVQRSKQGSSVYYTAPNAAEQTVATAQDEPQPEQAE
jgi:hypothetical protein